jgi:hypothetical protein
MSEVESPELEAEYQKLYLMTHKFKTNMTMYIEMMNDEETLTDCYNGLDELLNDVETEIQNFRVEKKVLEERIKKMEEEEEKKEKESKKRKGKKKVEIEDDE